MSLVKEFVRRIRTLFMESLKWSRNKAIFVCSHWKFTVTYIYLRKSWITFCFSTEFLIKKFNDAVLESPENLRKEILLVRELSMVCHLWHYINSFFKVFLPFICKPAYSAQLSKKNWRNLRVWFGKKWDCVFFLFFPEN